MARTLIHIDKDKCVGCGACITGCAEGALALVDGKATLVNKHHCDGLGACIGTCPTGALTLREEDTSEQTPSTATPTQTHEPAPQAPAGGCPGRQMRMRTPSHASVPTAPSGGHVMPSDLGQWPVQLHLVSPQAPFFKERELAVISTCAPLASADTHWRFIRGRSVVVACPKLDNTDPYVEKLAAILREPSIPAVYVVRMEVPCCKGLTRIVTDAVEASGRTDIRVNEIIVTLDGDVQETTIDTP